MQSIKNSNQKIPAPQKKLNAYSLAGLGIGSIIGSGFFLGCAISIQQTGPSVVLTFLLCGFLFSQVLGAMTSISINRPVTGSFKVYAEQFLGKYIGFLTGWILFFANILTIGSEAVAAGIFLRYWLPQFPLAPLSCFVILLVIAVNRLNTEDFGLVESGMAAIKIFALLFFIAAGIRFLTSQGVPAEPFPFHSPQALFPGGVTGFLQSMLVVIFTYAGVSTVAMATAKVRSPQKDIPKATVVMTIGTVLLYVVTIFLIVCIIKWNSVSTSISPLVQAFEHMGFGWASSAMNVVIVVAALSVMIGNYFGSVQVLASLSEAREAPSVFGRTTPNGFYRNAWMVTGILALLVAAVSFALSSKLFNYLISASSFFTFFNWSINLIVYWRWRNRREKSEKFSSPLILGKPGSCLTLVLLFLLAAASLFVKDFRIGFYTAASISLLISAAYLLRKRGGKESPRRPD